MERRILPLALCLMFGLTAPATADAQDAAPAGAGVVIMKLESFDASPEVVTALSEGLATTIDGHAEMHVKPGAQMTIKDLALTAGCGQPDEACMSKLRDFVDADRVAFGSVKGTGETHFFNLKMFDFEEGRFVASLSEQTVEGDPAHVVSVVPAIVDGFLYGDVGTLVVETSGAESVDVLFDGLKVGVAPTTLENLPLGEHDVVARTSDGQERSERIVLRYNEPGAVSFAFDPVAKPDDEKDGGGRSMVPGIVSIGLGVVGIGVGAFSSLQVNEAKSDSERLVNDGLIDPSGGGAFTSAEAIDDAKAANLDPIAIDKRGKQFTVIQFVGYGVGAVGVGVGIFLLARAMGGSDSKASAALPFDFGISPSRDGTSAWLRTSF